MLIPFIFSGCVKKAEEKTTDKVENIAITKVKELPPKEENAIPAMIARNFVVNLNSQKFVDLTRCRGLYVLLKKLLHLKVN